MSDHVMRWWPGHVWIRATFSRSIQPGHRWMYSGIVRRDTMSICGHGLVVMRMPYNQWTEKRPWFPARSAKRLGTVVDLDVVSDQQDFDTREWRVGQHYGVHVYAVNPDGEDDPIASFLGDRATAERMAAQVVAEHAMLCAPYADDQHRGGHWLDVLPQRPRWAQ